MEAALTLTTLAFLEKSFDGLYTGIYFGVTLLEYAGVAAGCDSFPLTNSVFSK